MSDQTTVLIIGAGPTGLIMASELSRYGIDYRIIDKRPERTKTSNALGIHPRTMEMLEDMHLIDNFLKLGQRIDAFSINEGGENIVHVSTNQIESFYNFILTLPQTYTEEIIDHHIAHLGKHVERSKALTHIEKNSDTITAKLTDAAGTTESVQCQWLLACDGAHSTVRELTKIPFVGSDLPEQFIIADVHVETNYPDNQITSFLSEDGPLAIFPIKTGSVRLVANLLDRNRDSKQPISLLEIQEITKKRTVGLVKVKDSIWASSFWIHSKMVSQMRDGSVFFLGDAAHIHSPAGGQGMNTGMQDAYNLAWKLALVIKGQSKEELLDSYHQERHPIAEEVLRDTERMTKFILSRNPIIRLLRKTLLKTLMKFHKIQHAFVMKLSQLTMHYPASPIIDYENRVDKKGPLPGEHAPDAFFINNEGKEKRILKVISGTLHHLLIFTGKKPSEETLEKIKLLHEWAEKQKGKMRVTVISHPKVFECFSEHCELDTNSNLHIKYNAKQACFYLIRPDKYVGCCSTQLETQIILDYYENF